MDNSIKQDFLEITKGFKAYLNYHKEVFHRIYIAKGSVSDSRQDAQDSQAGILTLEDVRSELGQCTRCSLHKSRTNIVFGEGNPHARLMFVGEGPGYDEDVQGRPFVGRAGGLLTKIIEAIRIKRSDVYIANIIKSRPPENRAPHEDEIRACLPFLIKQIEAVSPKIIVALGNIAAQALLGTDSKITQLRGRFYNFKGIQVMPTFHPAYLLRNPKMKRPVWNDMQMVQKAYNEVK